MRKFLWLALAFAACGNDTRVDETEVPPPGWLLEQLTPAEGLSIRTPEFAVAPGEEIQDCYFFQVPADASMMVDRIALALHTGSHHMNVFRVRTIKDLDPAAGEAVDLGGLRGTVVRGAASSACWKSSNWADWPLIVNSQQSKQSEEVLDWPLPEGVATRLETGETLMLQLHYVNATEQTEPVVGRGGVNFYRSVDGDTQELGTMFGVQPNVRVCRSNPRATFTGRCMLPGGTHQVIAANGHFHSRGRQLQIWGWNGVAPTGAPFYRSANWEEPPMSIGIDVALPAPGGVQWSCDYEWVPPAGGCAELDAKDPMHANDCCYVFGPTVENNEHCNAFIYYYPKVDGPAQCTF